MKAPMPPPPPRNPNPNPSSSMPPPPPPPIPSPPPPEPDAAEKPNEAPQLNPNPSSGDPSAEEAGNHGRSSGDSATAEAGNPSLSSSDSGTPPPPAPQRTCTPYDIPAWSAAPSHPFFLEVLKDGSIIEKLDVSKKGAYMFGRIDLCDFVLEHPTISRFHAVLQFRKDDQVFLYDLGSTHGSFINKIQIKKKVYTEIHVGDVIRFGLSSRLYIFQGPSELMLPYDSEITHSVDSSATHQIDSLSLLLNLYLLKWEKDMQKYRDSKIRQEMLDCEASLLRAKTQAALAEGITWGMAEDAVEEYAEDDADEITWQTYKGQLTDRQEKTRSKIIKRMEKVTNMKKEIDAIRAKDISQGGLTQGQQTQIARNEQRISQIMEELDNLEETLNDSIRESLGARAGNATHGNHKASLEEEDDILSDEDEFYDRTKKKTSGHKPSEQQSVETADSLLDKKDSITKDIEAKRKLLEDEKNKLAQTDNADAGDDLDAYMSGLSSQLVHDKIAQIQKELSDLQAELDKIVYLLKVADPMGEAARKRDLRPQETKTTITDNPKHVSNKESKLAQTRTLVDKNLKESCSIVQQIDKSAEAKNDVSKDQQHDKPTYVVPNPQWLGDKRIIEPEENCIKEERTDVEEPDNFVDYKDRKTVLAQSGSGNELEEAAPGLIIRKRKSVDQSAATSDKASSISESSSVESENSAVDAVALLLKHKRGYHSLEDGEDRNQPQSNSRKGKKSKQKRVLGPARPEFLDASPDYEAWVPPEGQTGDGRTALNDRLGY